MNKANAYLETQEESGWVFCGLQYPPKFPSGGDNRGRLTVQQELVFLSLTLPGQEKSYPGWEIDVLGAML